MTTAPTIKACWLRQSHASWIKAESSRCFPYETGGVLIGYVNDDVAVVTEIVGPGPCAIHRSARFLPDHSYQSREVERIFTGSGGVHTYLGDWHSHPNGVAQLSATDRKTLRQIAHSPEAFCSRPLMLLCAGGDSGWIIGAFTLIRKRLRGIAPIDVHTYHDNLKLGS